MSTSGARHEVTHLAYVAGYDWDENRYLELSVNVVLPLFRPPTGKYYHLFNVHTHSLASVDCRRLYRSNRTCPLSLITECEDTRPVQ